jgi:methionyl-tRNA formyltransferase
MTPKIDAGGMMSFARTPIDPDETADELEDRLAQLGAPLVAEAIASLAAGTAKILPQDRSKVTKAPKLSKEDGRIDWTRSNVEVHNLVRAMQPWPVASTYWLRPVGPMRLIVHQTKPETGEGAPGQVLEALGDRLIVAAGSGAVQLLRVQLEGKKPCPVDDFLRGHQLHQAFFGNPS